MATEEDILGLLYLKQDSKIANYLGISEERVAKVRAKHKKPEPTADPLPEPLEEVLAEPMPTTRESVLAPSLCPTCGAPVGTRLMVTHIQALVAAYYKIPVREMTSRRQSWDIAHPRQVAMYLTYELTPKSMSEIGNRFGDRDHTTVIHAIKQVQKRMLEDAEIEADVKALRERLAA